VVTFRREALLLVSVWIGAGRVLLVVRVEAVAHTNAKDSASHLVAPGLVD
jgi:hypothetical protein